MRTFLSLLLAFALGGGLTWLLLRTGEPSGPDLPPTTARTGEGEIEENPHLRVRNGTLVVRVQAPDGSVPPGAEVGYEHFGELRLLYAGSDGMRQFADAPLGEIVVVGRANGYADARTPRVLLAGVPEEVRLILQPRRD